MIRRGALARRLRMLWARCRASARLARSTHAVTVSSIFRFSSRSSVNSAWIVRAVLSVFARSTRSRSSSSVAFVNVSRADSRSASTRDSSAYVKLTASG